MIINRPAAYPSINILRMAARLQKWLALPDGATITVAGDFLGAPEVLSDFALKNNILTLVTTTGSTVLAPEDAIIHEIASSEIRFESNAGKSAKWVIRAPFRGVSSL